MVAVPAAARAAEADAHVRLLAVEVVLRLGVVAARQPEELVLGRLAQEHAVRLAGGRAQPQALGVRPHAELVVRPGNEV